MSDMGPRRVSDMGRPVGPAPQPQGQPVARGRVGVRSQPVGGAMPAQRPMNPAQRPAGGVPARPMAPQQRPVGAAQRPMQSAAGRPMQQPMAPAQRPLAPGGRPMGRGAGAQQPMQPAPMAQRAGGRSPMTQQQAMMRQQQGYGAQGGYGDAPEAAMPVAKGKPRKQKQPRAEGSSGWRVVLQFVVGLLVIVGVAAAIVTLYVRYYQ